jgi:hypothetical protein
MNSNIIILGISMAGFTLLYFFPDPQTNFIAYSATAISFFLLILIVVLKSRRKMHPRMIHH